MSKLYTTGDLAQHFGITHSQVCRELQSFPYQGRGTCEIRFTESDVAEITRLMNAGPDEQLERLLLLDAKRAALQAQDEQMS